MVHKELYLTRAELTSQVGFESLAVAALVYKSFIAR